MKLHVLDEIEEHVRNDLWRSWGITMLDAEFDSEQNIEDVKIPYITALDGTQEFTWSELREYVKGLVPFKFGLERK